MSGDRRFVGEGQLGWVDSLGGKGALFPVVAGLLGISAMGAFDRFASFSLALGALVPIWFAWRMRVPHALVRTLRRGRPWFRVELDDLGVRTSDLTGRPTSPLEWFELERYHAMDYGLVLVMRVAKNGVNAVLVPKAFFPVGEWPSVQALVREKLPGSAKAHDDALAQGAEQRRRSARHLVPTLLAIVLLFGLLYWLLYGWLQSTR